MARDSNIPLFLWITTAVLAHIAWGGGADKVSDKLQETLDIKRFAVSVRSHVRSSYGTFEVALGEPQPAQQDEKPPEEETDSDDTDDPDEEDPDEDESQDKEDEELKTKPKDKAKAKPEPPKPEEKKKKPPEPKQKTPKPPELKVEKKPEPKPKPEQKTVQPKPLPKIPPGKIAVGKQQSNDIENKNADKIADRANKVDEETQARITATNQNDPKPNPGGNHSSAEKAPGNSDDTKVAQADDSPGEEDRAPTEDAEGDTKDPTPDAPPEGNAAAPGRPKPSPADVSQSGAKQAPKNSPSRSARPAQKAQSAVKARKAIAGAPETVHAPGGAFSIPKARKSQSARKGRKGRKRRRRLPRRRARANYRDMFGLGAAGRTRNGISLNLTPQLAYKSLGKDKLRDMRRADGRRRRSKHRGSWRSVGIERWRASIENYVSTVKPGNQTALNTARVPFASYLNQIHNRLHPIFADSFLGSLGRLPNKHSMNRAGLKTDLEIVVDQNRGRLVKMGVTKTSGVTAFDIAALEAVHRAQPFGTPPKEIISPDGNVYLHWEFHRDPRYACSTYFARPFILKVKPKTRTPKVKPRPFSPKERPPSKTGRVKRSDAHKHAHR